MKKLVYIVSLLAAAAFTVVSCQKKEEAHQPGPQEAAGCYGVFFPSQAASGSHVYSPVEDPSIDIIVKRTNTSGAITVPVIASFSEDGIFTMNEVSFADGQDETTFTVRFDNAAEGNNYSASFTIEDNNYASLYNSNPISLDFSVMRVEMKTFQKEDGSGVANITCTDNVFWGEVHDEITIQYYEVDGIRYCETVGGKLKSPADGTVGEGPWGTGCQIKFKWYTKKTVVVNDVEYQWIEVEPNYMGYDSANGPVYMGDFYWMRDDMGLGNGSYTSSYDRYVNGSDGYTPSYYDGHGGFMFHSAYWIHGTTSWYGYKDNCPEAIAEGYTRVDYSIKVAQAGVSEGSEVPVKFTLGPDVNKVVYKFAEGQLTATQIGNVLAEMSYDSEDCITEGSGTYAFNLGKTGVYTLVAATYDEKGGQQESASCEITYLSEENAKEYAVVIEGGVGSAAKYVPSGVNTDNSLEIYLYGKDIVEAKLAVFSYADLVGGYSACVEKLMKTKSVSAATIEAINGDGYVDVVTGLLPGTQYYMLVYASNGYSETTELFGSEYTTGQPLMVYRNFTVADYDPAYACESKAGMIGTWNYYGIDLDESLGLREYLGKVVISDAGIDDAPYEATDGNTYYEQYLNLKGLSAGSVAAAKSYELVDTDDDTVTFSFDTGDQILYVSSYWAAGFDSYDVAPFYFTQYSVGLGGWYRATYYMAAIPVADGYFAFVDVSGAGYDFNAWRFMCGGYRWLSVQDPLLVNPDKDDSGLAKASLDATVANAKKLMRESVKEVSNYVMTEKGRLHAAMQLYNEKQTSVKAFNTMLGVKGGELPLRIVKPVSVKACEDKAVDGRHEAPKTVK